MNDENLTKILAAHSTELTTSLKTIVACFYQGLNQDPASHRVLSILTEEELQRLHQSQAAHLQLLIDSTVDEVERKETAEKAGDMHAIIGVPASSLVNAFGLCLQGISQAILSFSCPLVERSVLLHVVNRRLQEDLQWQMERLDVHQSHIDRVEQTLMTFSQSHHPWADVIRGVLNIFLEIPGITGSGFVFLSYVFFNSIKCINAIVKQHVVNFLVLCRLAKSRGIQYKKGD